MSLVSRLTSRRSHSRLVASLVLVLFLAFNSPLGVSSGDETLHLMLDILHPTEQC